MTGPDHDRTHASASAADALAALFPLATGVPLSAARIGDAQRLLAREIELMASFADHHGPPAVSFAQFDPSWS